MCLLLYLTHLRIDYISPILDISYIFKSTILTVFPRCEIVILLYISDGRCSCHQPTFELCKLSHWLGLVQLSIFDLGADQNVLLFVALSWFFKFETDSQSSHALYDLCVCVRERDRLSWNSFMTFVLFF